MIVTKPKSKPAKAMRYHRVPRKWKPELNRYVVEYLQSGCRLSVREYCRNYNLPQGVAKRYITAPLRDWMLSTLLDIRSIDAELELQLGSKSRGGLGVYSDLFED